MSRIIYRPKLQAHIQFITLVERQINKWFRFLGQLANFKVLRYAYNRQFFTAYSDPIADRVLIGPKSLRECLIYNDCVLRLLIILIVKIPPFDYRYPHNIKIVGGYHIIIYLHVLI